MKFKWLAFFIAVLIIPFFSWSQEQPKRAVYPGTFMPPGIRIDKPIAYFKINENPDTPSYGYSFGADAEYACSGMCFEPNTKLIFSGYKDIEMSDGRKLRNGLIQTIVDPSGASRNVESEKLTVPVGVVTTSGIPFFNRKQEFTPSLPVGSFFANSEGEEIRWAIPIAEGTEAGICPGPNCPEEEGQVQKLIGAVTNLLHLPNTQTIEAARVDLSKQERYFASQCRTSEARDNQMTCSPSELNKYMNEYKEYILLASKAFNVPADMLACLLFKEGKFGVGSTSHSGAAGLAQFVTPGALMVNNLIRPIQTQSCKGKKGSDLIRCQARNTSENRRKKYRENWEAYFNTLLKSKKYKNHKAELFPDKTYGDFKIPPQFTKETGAKLPPAAIAASAVYLKYIIEDRTNAAVRSSVDRNSLEFKKFVVGAYNAGDGMAATIKSRSKHGLVADMLYVTQNHYGRRNASAGQEKRAETARHMQHIGDCIEGKIPPAKKG